MNPVGTSHALVLIALLPAGLVLAVRFFAERTARGAVAVDAVLVAVAAWILWNAGSRAKTVHELLGYAAILAATVLTLAVRWLRARDVSGSNRTDGP